MGSIAFELVMVGIRTYLLTMFTACFREHVRSECDTMDKTRTPWPNNLAATRANSRGCQHISRLHDLLAGGDVTARPARCTVVSIDLGSRESRLAGWGDQGRIVYIHSCGGDGTGIGF